MLDDRGLREDLPSLWRKCRQVCRTFRDIVDDIFRKEVLPDMMIEFDLDWDYLDQENLTMKCFFGLEMAFDRFADENKEIAVFKNSIRAHEKEPGFIETHDKLERAKWEEKLSVYTPPDAVGSAAMDTRFDLPPWTIELRGSVNDTELPGWKVDFEKKEISFKWKDAMEAFYREVEYIDKTVYTEVSAYQQLTLACHSHWLRSKRQCKQACSKSLPKPSWLERFLPPEPGSRRTG